MDTYKEEWDARIDSMLTELAILRASAEAYLSALEPEPPARRAPDASRTPALSDQTGAPLPGLVVGIQSVLRLPA